MVLKISINGFRLLKPVARKTGCRISIVRKRGLPFILNRYRRRKTFIIGAVLFVFMFFYLSSFVWDIEVTGNKNVDTLLIIDTLENIGIKTGMLKYGIDADKIANNMMLSIDELGWIGVAVKGTKIKIEVVERVIPPAIVPRDVPCDIAASRDGVIKSIVAKQGREMVKAGDTVTKGQILISGTIPNANNENSTRQVHAIGTIKARTWYEASFPVETLITEKVRTGIKKDIYSVVFFTKRIGILKESILFKDYERIEIKKRLSIGEDLVLPFEFNIDRYYECSYREQEIDIEEAKQIAADNAYREASMDIPENAEVVTRSIDFIEKDEDILEANVVIECVEDIGVTEEIGGN